MSTRKVVSRLGKDDIMVEAQALQVLMSRYVPLATSLTSASWDDDAKTAADNGVLDLSAVFGAPAKIRAAHVVLWVADGTPGVACRMGSGAAETWFGQYTQVADGRVIAAGLVSCDANGDIYVVFTGDIDHVWLYITGYVI